MANRQWRCGDTVRARWRVDDWMGKGGELEIWTVQPMDTRITDLPFCQN